MARSVRSATKGPSTRMAQSVAAEAPENRITGLAPLPSGTPWKVTRALADAPATAGMVTCSLYVPAATWNETAPEMPWAASAAVASANVW